jgi:hypothetical protein
MDLTANKPSASLSDIIAAVAPKRFLRDPFGFFSGYRAYLVYTHLSAKSDAELADLDLERTELPRVAMSAILDS